MRHDPRLHEGLVCGINWKWRGACDVLSLSSGMDGSSPRLRCPRKDDASLEPRVATHLLLASSREVAGALSCRHVGHLGRRRVRPVWR
jgi:hypothetical protein